MNLILAILLCVISEIYTSVGFFLSIITSATAATMLLCDIQLIWNLAFLVAQVHIIEILRWV